MIIIEDKDLEDAVLAGDSCIAVPFEIWMPEQGESQITVYSYFENIAGMYETFFKDALFEADALKWLDDRLYATVKSLGYTHAFEDVHFLEEYVIDELSQLHKQSTFADVKIIESESELDCADISLVSDIFIGGKTAIITDGDKLVSVACLNDVSFEDESVEIYVETDPLYRGRGYGTAAVEALTRALLEEGNIVRYKCSVNNHASKQVAEKCGFKKTGRRYSYVCYSID